MNSEARLPLRIRLAIALGLAAAAAGCGRPDQRPAPPPNDGAKRFPLTGVIEKVADVRTLEIRHNDIEGFMPAMTMPFKIKERPATDFSPGDVIKGTLAVGDKESWVEGLKVMGRLALAAPKPEHPLGAVGDPLPVFELTNQEGRRVKTSSYLGRILLITFIYTRCPLPEFCPRMMSQYREIDRAVAAEPALRGRVHLVAVSFDPKFDTPDVLTAYGSAFVEDRGKGLFADWEFMTGSFDDIRRIADYFGVVYYEESGGFGHNLRTGIIGPSGRVERILMDNTWEPSEALNEIRRLAPSVKSGAR